jgi:HSP20 family protein
MGDLDMANVIPWRKSQTEQPLVKLRDECDALFDRFFSRLPTLMDTENDVDRFWELEVDDRNNEVVVRAEVPGFEADELDVQLDGTMLVIKAEKKQESKGSGNGHTTERSYRAYYRSVTLPQGVNADGISAKYRNGVLEIHVPTSEESKAKRISVQA